jgi:ethanolamine ammonia-lyase small subunit
MTAPPPTLWTDLRRFTQARVALGRAGNGLPTRPHLDFQAAHAVARDAVHAPLDVPALQAALGDLPSISIHSEAPDRRTYLMRPDLGRRLPPEEAARLPPAPGTMLFVVCDGLSATAVQRHAPALLALMVPRIQTPVAPVVIASQGRVALGDAIGAAMQADAVVVLIGERPGLSSADSLGAYLTWAPRVGLTDADRNCVSNIRPAGLPIPAAADKLLWLINAMWTLRLSGVALKDEQPLQLAPP